MYEDYLENFVFRTAKEIAMKLFGRVRKSKSQPETEDELKDEKLLTETKSNENSEDKEEDKDAQDEGVEQMLDEAMAKQQQEKAKRDAELKAARIEYDSITEGLSEINFHLPLFFLLLVLTLLSTPSTVTWAKNYHYSRVLSPDPTLVPATCVLIALSFIWQMPTPRGL